MTVKVWWLGSERGQGNFGDILTPAILQHFNIKYEFVKNYKDADIISVGSIARRAATGTVVLGSGIINKGEKINPNAHWKFVRGPYTRNRVLELGGKCPELYGDPALLLPFIVNPREKEFKIGYVPHNVDFNFVSNNFKNKNIISLSTSNYKNVIDKITKCEKIISSSLHGIICAHAYGIPAAWVESNKKLKGDDVKFKDYFESVGIYNYEKSAYNDPKFINPGSIDLAPIIKIFKELGNSND